MDALNKANEGYAMPYGNDPIMDDVRTMIRDRFEAPEAAVYLTATGTSANCTAHPGPRYFAISTAISRKTNAAHLNSTRAVPN